MNKLARHLGGRSARRLRPLSMAGLLLAALPLASVRAGAQETSALTATLRSAAGDTVRLWIDSRDSRSAVDGRLMLIGDTAARLLDYGRDSTFALQDISRVAVSVARDNTVATIAAMALGASVGAFLGSQSARPTASQGEKGPQVLRLDAILLGGIAGGYAGYFGASKLLPKKTWQTVFRRE